MVQVSAGILLHRGGPAGLEVLLAHMGGPFWAHKDEAAWSVPKGIVEDGEDPMAAARREFAEELGSPAPDTEYVDLGPLRASGKILRIWAGRGEFDVTGVHSNTVEIEWPPRSGRRLVVPEIDRAAWWGAAEAENKLVKGQRPLLDRLRKAL